MSFQVKTASINTIYIQDKCPWKHWNKSSNAGNTLPKAEINLPETKTLYRNHFEKKYYILNAWKYTDEVTEVVSFSEQIN